MEIINATLNDKPVAYTDQTEFLVQIGKDRGGYRTKYKFVGKLGTAVAYYNAVNIGRGYKKRLIAPGMNKPVLARAFS